ncbi:Glutamyl-Q tRNA(Asp) synthetase [Burkholderiales bacterium]|nr:Glutamyl-Q tRNA(Asp) synthetase [Burkholderiales bacterium]
MRSYRGRFAPSPTGPLHRGSLAAALASWLDTRAHSGKWLIRIEDIDPPREQRGIAQEHIALLARFGMTSDEPVLYQSTRTSAYQGALQQLLAAGRTYRCDCPRGRRKAQSPDASLAPYPGTCRTRQVRSTAATRLLVPPGVVGFTDRACGWFAQSVEQSVGDFVIQRIDGLWAYQLAVVVDDAFQEVTDVVRGADLLDNTPRQMMLQQALGLPTPRYLHLPLVRDACGRKLSKQTQALAIDVQNLLAELEHAWAHLGFEPTGARGLEAFQRQAISAWRRRWCEREFAEPASLPAQGPA